LFSVLQRAPPFALPFECITSASTVPLKRWDFSASAPGCASYKLWRRLGSGRERPQSRVHLSYSGDRSFHARDGGYDLRAGRRREDQQSGSDERQCFQAHENIAEQQTRCV